MAVTINKLGPGTLKLGSGTPTEFGVQVSSCALVPAVREEDGIPTLGDPEPVATMDTTWTLKGEAVSDWAEANGLVAYCFDHAGTLVDFEFTPNTTLGVKFTGSCQVRALEIGGEVGAVLKAGFELPVKGQPVRGTATTQSSATSGTK